MKTGSIRFHVFMLDSVRGATAAYSSSGMVRSSVAARTSGRAAPMSSARSLVQGPGRVTFAPSPARPLCGSLAHDRCSAGRKYRGFPGTFADDRAEVFGTPLAGAEA